MGECDPAFSPRSVWSMWYILQRHCPNASLQETEAGIAALARDGRFDEASARALDPKQGWGAPLEALLHKTTGSLEVAQALLLGVREPLRDRLARRPDALALMSATSLLIGAASRWKIEQMASEYRALEQLPRRHREGVVHCDALSERVERCRARLEGFVRVNRSEEELFSSLPPLIARLHGTPLEADLLELVEALELRATQQRELQALRQQALRAKLDIDTPEALDGSLEEIKRSQRGVLERFRDHLRCLLLDVCFVDRWHRAGKRAALRLALEGYEEDELGPVRGHGGSLERRAQALDLEPQTLHERLRAAVDTLEPSAHFSLRCWLYEQLALGAASTSQRTHSRTMELALEARVAEHHRLGEYREGIRIALEGYSPNVTALGRIDGYETAIQCWMYQRNQAMGLDEEDLIDAYQRGLEQVCLYFPAFQWRSKFKTWSYKLSASAMSWQRRHGHDRDAFAQRVDLERELHRSRARTATRFRTTLRAQVREALAQRLTPTQWELLHLRDYQQFSFNEIATLMLVAEGEHEPQRAAVKRRAATLRKRYGRLKEQLSELAPHLPQLTPSETTS